MGIVKKLMNKARGIDPFFEEVRAEQIGSYQHYFIKIIQSIDVDTQTNWSMGKPYDKDHFLTDEKVMEKIIVGEASTEGLIPAIRVTLVTGELTVPLSRTEDNADRATAPASLCESTAARKGPLAKSLRRETHPRMLSPLGRGWAIPFFGLKLQFRLRPVGRD